MGGVERRGGRKISLRQEKRAQRFAFGVQRLLSAVGVFHSKGVVVEKFGPSLESLFSLGFEGAKCPTAARQATV